MLVEEDILKDHLKKNKYQMYIHKLNQSLIILNKYNLINGNKKYQE